MNRQSLNIFCELLKRHFGERRVEITTDEERGYQSCALLSIPICVEDYAASRSFTLKFKVSVDSHERYPIKLGEYRVPKDCSDHRFMHAVFKELSWQLTSYGDEIIDRLVSRPFVD